MRISDWSSDVCSSDLLLPFGKPDGADRRARYELWKPFVLECIAAMIEKRAGGAVARGKEGRSREAAPRLQRKEAEFDQSEPEPAIALGQRDAGPALLAWEEHGRASGGERGCRYG